MKTAMNIESILSQFGIVEQSLRRAKLPFETDMMFKESIEVTLWELVKSYNQIENIIREIDPERFGASYIQKTVLHLPEISNRPLHLCDICGDPECQSDHK